MAVTDKMGIRNGFFCGRTTKRRGGGKTPEPQKKLFRLKKLPKPQEPPSSKPWPKWSYPPKKKYLCVHIVHVHIEWVEVD